MKGIRRVCRNGLVITVSATLFVFVYGGENFLVSLLTAVLVSMPMIVSYFIFYWVSGRTSNSQFMNALAWAFLGVYAINFLVSFVLVVMFTIDVLSKGHLGPAQGYWLLLTWGLGIKFSFFGLIIGGFMLVFYQIRKEATQK